jgi:hypothetical protein
MAAKHPLHDHITPLFRDRSRTRCDAPRAGSATHAEFIVADDLGREDAADWVRANRTTWAGLPALVQKEIGRALND